MPLGGCLERGKMKQKPLVIGEFTAPIPVIQGGMGVGVSLDRLAGAVAKEGGIGVISTAQIGFMEDEYENHPLKANLSAIGKVVKRAREAAAGGVIGANIMVATNHYEEYVKAAVEAQVDLIISGAGLPVDLPQYVKNTRTKIAPIVSSEKAANVILKLWDRKYQKVPDLVVIEGPEAGGHLGFSREELEKATQEGYAAEVGKILSKVQQYAEKYQTAIPVVMAGGIYNRQDMERIMALGVDGVQVATRFVTTEECDAAEAYKQTYLDCRREDIVIVDSPVGLPGRAIRNRFLEEGKRHPEKYGAKKCRQCIAGCEPAKIPYCISRALIAAVKGDVEEGLLFCGANAYRAERMENVRDIMREFA